MKIKVGIAGYGNLGKSAEKIIPLHEDMELTAIFSRRPSNIKTTVPVYPLDEAEKYKDEVDVLLLCLGSATDIPEYADKLLKNFHVVDVYDNHRLLYDHQSHLDQVGRAHNRVAIIGVGWDPGLFSLNRLLAASILPGTTPYTFWGDGVSQGHSDAIRKVKGVKYGIQYTLPNPEALKAAEEGHGEDFEPKQRHLRRCYVVCDLADQARIEREICTMPDYFEGYDTEVNFICEEDFKRDHQAIPHGGRVISSGRLKDTDHLMSFQLRLSSNPDFTAAVLVAYGRAAYRCAREKNFGAKTIFDIPISYLSQKSAQEMIQDYL